MNMKTMLCVAAAALSTSLMATDTPEVSNVVMTQANFGRKVTITYDLSNAANGAVVTLDIETNKTGSATNVDSDWVSIGGAAVCNAQGDVWKKVSQGSKTITWRPDHSWEGHKVELANGGARAVVTAWALDNTPDYMVVDISAAAQPNTQRYYPAVDFLPGSTPGQKGSITNNPAYRTTMLVMRKIMAKDVTWTMGSVSEPGRSSNEATHTVTLDRNYYIGVFEFTQTQWALIAPGMTYPRVAPSKFALEGDKAMRPVEQVSYYDIRARTNEGDAEAKSSTDYPHAPADGSFLAVLRTMTGIDFDLPLESQWEFACRAGNGEGHWGDGTPFASNLSNVPGRFADNGGMLDGGSLPTSDSTAEHGTAIVGSYAPNCWGLYDMHGNVGELVLDYYVNDISSYNGAYVPHPSPADRAHLARGGVWSGEAKLCRSADRHVANDIAVWSGARFSEYGFRVVCYAGLD